MKYEYDKESDCGYITIKEGDVSYGEVSYSKEVTDNILVDFAEDGTVIGVELISVRTLDRNQSLCGACLDCSICRG